MPQYLTIKSFMGTMYLRDDIELSVNCGCAAPVQIATKSNTLNDSKIKGNFRYPYLAHGSTMNELFVTYVSSSIVR